jgi:predicted regulator of Ras-like GTPase activity (Roadblock/LC7/MglB family)
MLRGALFDLLGTAPELAGVAIVGHDGIPLEIQTRGEFDVNTLAAEFADLVKGMTSRLTDAKMGSLSGMTVETPDHRIIIEPVAAGYFLLGVMRPGGVAGRVRFLLKKASLVIAPALA